ncbi:hypothetical protein JW977_02740 [Candidatus Falkowbacteria bacterium]|nr:hypothetical protein [Candidatus Falkowbacteria bacterium]
MKSLARRFTKIQNRNSYYSSYLCFAMAIKGRGFTKKTISHWFNRLVVKDDYSQSDKRGILKHLELFANTSEDRPN